MRGVKKTRARDFDFHERFMVFARARMRDRRASGVGSDVRAIRTDVRRVARRRRPTRACARRALRGARARGRTRARTPGARERRARFAVDRFERRSIDRRARQTPTRDADPTRDVVVNVAAIDRRRATRAMMATPRELDAPSAGSPARDDGAKDFRRTESVDGEAIARERAHSFSTQCSSQTTIADLGQGRDDDDDRVEDERVAFDVARDRDARAIDERAERETRDAMVALARARADAIGPDGADLCADVARELLRRERADHGAFVLDGATAHHAAYRAQLVEWILDVCAGERYGPTTADVAIGYMVRGRCDATRSTVSPPGWLIRGRGPGAILSSPRPTAMFGRTAKKIKRRKRFETHERARWGRWRTIERTTDDERGRDECAGSSVVENRGAEDVFTSRRAVLLADCGEIRRD